MGTPEKQIPFGDDNKKDSSKSNGKEKPLFEAAGRREEGLFEAQVRLRRTTS